MNRTLTPAFYLRYLLRGWRERLHRTGPIFVTLFVTSQCNARCSHCFYLPQINSHRDDLTLEELESIARSLPDFPKLLLSGGEPFLRRDVAEICQLFSRYAGVRQITIPTNGILTERIAESVARTLEICPETHLQLQLSIDGIGERHDRMRGVPGAFDALMNTYRQVHPLEDQCPRLEINFCFTFCAANQDQLEQTDDHVASLGARSMNVLALRPPVTDPSLLDYDVEAYLAWNRRFDQEHLGPGRNLSERLFALRRRQQVDIIERVLSDPDYTFPCSAGTHTAIIDETGRVFPCESRPEPFGSLREVDFDFKRIWGSEAARRFRREVSSPGCRCTHESNTITNLSFSMGGSLRLLVDLLRGRSGRSGSRD